MSGGQRLNIGESRKMWKERETFCQVETKKEETVSRAQRKHFPHHNLSSAFQPSANIRDDTNSNGHWLNSQKKPIKHYERRHYKGNY